MNGRQYVFQDRLGRRWTRVRIAAGVGVLVLVTLLTIFIRALWVKPDLHVPESLRAMKSELRTMTKPPPRKSPPEQPWLRYRSPAPAEKNADQASGEPRIAAAILAGWDPRSIASLRGHATQLTHLCPEMFTVTGQPAKLRNEADEETRKAIRASDLQIVPILSNLAGDDWDTDAVEGLLLSDPAEREPFLDTLLAALRDADATGVLLDWQGIDPALSGEFVAFLQQMQQRLHGANIQLWVSIPVGGDLKTFDLAKISEVADHLVAQLHDENAEDDPPGPIASQPWFEGWLRTLLSYGRPGQWILSLGAYGYDWNTSNGTSASVSFADAMACAQRSGVEAVTSSAPDYNPGLTYFAEGDSHEVWFLDATTFANEIRAVAQEGAAGVLINRLGTEDPGIWQALEAATTLPELPPQFASLAPGDVIAQIGEGDFLRAELHSAPGHREAWQNAEGYFCETYRQWPVFPTVVHLGHGTPGNVAITFDDGPDPDWTPQILDILKKYGIHATFFIIGKNAEAHPDLIRRILREGHEIGSHTYTHPNLSEAGPETTMLELNATQRLLEWLTGRTTILFRPPYNADSMPSSTAEARPIALATDLGYITVGESIDPQDWDRPSADEILRRIREQRNAGHTILLHDAGGDRSATVEALPRIIEFLQARGDTILRAGELIGLSPAETMPELKNPAHSAPTLITNAGLMALHWSEEFLWAFMIATSLLTLLRSATLAILALQRRKTPPAGRFSPPISIILAAFNEEKVLAATLRSIVRTDYPGPIEILVIDDGSTDATADEAANFPDPRIRLIRQPNAGKSAALARGLAEARHELLVFLDADTQFQPDTLRCLIRPLSDSRVGAVSGHARVGNCNTWLGHFQSLEYICGFNLDRRAYDSLNAITVVPGAISAFRRTAIASAGGFAMDTIAEDTDITLALHRAGWRVTYAPDALAWTEAPETVRALAKQRFRWAFGTMQCLWKHRDLFFNPRHGGLGVFSLPSIVLFQILLVAAIPLVDFALIVSLLTGAGLLFAAYFLAFLLCDLLLALLACGIEKEPLAHAAWIIPMRFFYRPVLSFVVWRSIIHILRGAFVGWGKLERTGTVAVPALGS